MKKSILILIGLIGAIATSVSAQIPNPGFENWTSGNPDGWFVTNVPGAFTTTTQTADAHSGSAAAQGEVVSFFGTLQAPIFQSGADGTGFPISQAFGSVDLFYKFSPQGGDRFAVNVSVHSNGTPIGAGAVAVPAAASNYTALSVPISYTSADIPDTAIIQISIVGPSGADFHLGSAMWVDDLSLSGATGTAIPMEAAAQVKVFPNPITVGSAQQMVQVQLAGLNPAELTAANPSGLPTANPSDFPGAQDGSLEVLDGTGKIIRTIPFATDGTIATVQIPVANLPSGMYFYVIKTSTSQAKGKFSVCH